MCERFGSSPALQAPKQLPTVTRTSFGGNAGGAPVSRGWPFRTTRSPFQQQRSLPQMRISYLANLLDRAVQHVLQHRLAAQHVGVKISWTRLRSTRSYLIGIWPGTNTPTIGSRLQRPVQPVRCRRMSVRPEAATCLRNSSNTSSAPAACSHVAEPTWMRMGLRAD